MVKYSPRGRWCPRLVCLGYALGMASLDNIPTYLDDTIGADNPPMNRVRIHMKFFARLCLHKLNLSSNIRASAQPTSNFSATSSPQKSFDRTTTNLLCPHVCRCPRTSNNSLASSLLLHVPPNYAPPRPPRYGPLQKGGVYITLLPSMNELPTPSMLSSQPVRS